jgi:putative transposase
METAVLRQRFTIYQRNQKHPRLRIADRVFGVVLRKLWAGWDRALIVQRPETVIAWHRQGFKLFWRRKAGRSAGWPRIPRSYIAFIRRISGDHSEWGKDRIAEDLAAKFGVHHSPSTIRRYILLHQNPPRAIPTRRTFIHNHAKEVWSCHRPSDLVCAPIPPRPQRSHRSVPELRTRRGYCFPTRQSIRHSPEPVPPIAASPRQEA